MVRSRAAASRTMRPVSSASSFETRLTPLLRMRRGCRACRVLRLALPLAWTAGLLDRDCNRQRLRAAAIAGAAHGGGAEVIQPDRDAGMRVRGADAIRGIEADPAEIGHVGFRPGVAGLLVDHAVGAQEVPGDETRRHAGGARAGDEDVRIV